MRRAVIAAIILLAGTIAMCHEDTGYRVKAVAVSGTGARSLEAKFLVLPQDLRLVCSGDPKGISVGDYIKVELKDHHFRVGQLICDEMKWYQ